MAYTTVSRAQLRALFDNQLGAGSQVFWRTDEKNRILQEAMRFFNLLTGFWKTRAIQPTMAAQVWYTLPGAITSTLRVSFNNYTLSPASAYDMDFGRPLWESEQTSDGGDVPQRPQLYVIGGLNLIAIWPADALGANSLVVDGIASTPILINDSSTVDIGQEEIAGLLDLAQHIASFKEGGAEFKATMPLLKSFLESAGARNAILRSSATYKKWLGLDKGKLSKPLMIGEKSGGAR